MPLSPSSRSRGRRSGGTPPGPEDRAKDALIAHVAKVQREVRTCEGCGLCCTEAFNSVAILPVEGARIARYLEELGAARREELLARLSSAVARYRLSAVGQKRRYTCPFLEPDLRCALPFEVKPVACLAFNPIHIDRCETDERRFAAAHDPLEARNAAESLPDRRTAIPVAVLAAYRGSRRAAPRGGRGR